MITHMTFSSTKPRRKPQRGDEKTLKSGMVMIRQECRTHWPQPGYLVGSRGQNLWEWVEKGSSQDRWDGTARYGTDRLGDLLVAPDGYRILECGKVVPKGALVYLQNYGEASAGNGWHVEGAGGFEAKGSGSVRAYAVPVTT